MRKRSATRRALAPLWPLLLATLASCSPPRSTPVAPSGAASAATASAAIGEAPPLLQLPRDVRPVHYTLSMNIEPQRERFSGKADIEIALDAPRSAIWLHGRDLHVTSVSVDAGQERLEGAWKQVTSGGVARIELPHDIGPGKATLHLAWDAPWGTHASGLYRARSGGDTYAVTQFEPIDARRAFPSFDEPSFKTPYDVTLTVPTSQVVVGNAPIVEQTPVAGDLTRVRFATTRPLPTYLVAWAVGPFDVVQPPPLPPNEVRQRPLQVRGIAPRGRGKALSFALSSGAELLVALERYFGIPYPYAKLDHIAVPETFGGAMENAGAIVYLDRWLLYDEGTSPEVSKLWIASVMAHEMAHQWFGNLVTLGWWTEVWLNESFAEWMGARVVQAWRPDFGVASDELKRLDSAMSLDSLEQARAIRQPLASTDQIDDQFDDLTYLKGGAVLGMFERWVGADAFRSGVHDYLVAHADGVGSTDELLAALARSSGKDVVEPFHTFLDQPGLPLVEARRVCGPGPASIQLAQRRYLPVGSHGDAKRTWRIPVCVRWGEAGQVREGCTMLAEPSGSLPIPGGRCPDWVLPNADGAGYYDWALDAEDLAQLMKEGYSKLEVRERISLAQSVMAAVRAGALSFADGMRALEVVARDADGDVAPMAMDEIVLARDYLVSDTQVSRVEAYGTELYGPVLQRLGWAPVAGESRATRQFRAALASFLVLHARDSQARAQGAKLGRAYAGIGDGRFHPEAVAPDLAGTALAAGVREGDRALFDALESRLGALEDSELRARVIEALSAATDPSLSARVLSLPLDKRLRQQERLDPLFGQAGQTETRERAWQVLQQRFDALVRDLDAWMSARLPAVAESFCDPSRAREVEAFFGPRMDRIPGARRTLDQTLEKIRLCAALKQAQGASATSFFGDNPHKPR